MKPSVRFLAYGIFTEGEVGVGLFSIEATVDLSFCLRDLKSPFSSSFRIFLKLLLQQERQRLRRQKAEAALCYNSIILKAALWKELGPRFPDLS